MPRRIIAFLLIIGFILSMSLLLPKINRKKLEYDSLNAIPNASPFGFKALFTLLQKAEPNRNISFWQHALLRYPTQTPQVIWFLEPGKNLMIVSPVMKEHTQALTRHGSHLVFFLNQANLAHHREERGLTLKELMSRHNTKEAKVYSTPEDVLYYLHDWFGITLQADRLEHSDDADVSGTSGDHQAIERDVISQYTTRPIASLGFRPVDHLIAAIEMRAQSDINPEFNEFSYFDAVPSNCKAMMAFVSHPDRPFIIECPINQGSITVVLNSELLRNYQLSRQDNAALALALVERYPASLPLRIDGYSQGFRDNPDLITLLMSGSGQFMLIACLLLLGMFVFNIVTTPPLKRYLLLNNVEETYFTHQTFIHTLAQHLCATGQWRSLYDESLRLVKRELTPRLFHSRMDTSSLSHEDWITALRDNPFAQLDDLRISDLFNPPKTLTKQQYQELTVSLMACRQRILHHDINTPSLATQRGAGHLSSRTR